MKKTLNVIKAILTWTLIVVAVGMMIFTVVSVNTFDRNDRSLFGYKAYIVLTDSMSSTNGDTSKGYFNAGDLVLAKEVDPSTLKEGDIISFISTNTESYGKTLTHMIKERTYDAEGNPGFVTYGTATGSEDANVVTFPFVLGKYETKLSGVGNFFLFLKTTPGYIACIFLPFLILIIIQGLNSIRLFKKYKQEQLAELEAARAKELEEIETERRRLVEERQKSEEMMAELLRMKELMKDMNLEDKS